MTAAGRPSWATSVTEVDGAPKRSAIAFTSRGWPVSLVAGVAGAVALAVAEAVHVLGRDDLLPAMRGFLVAVVAGQVVLAWLALRRSAAAVMGLLLCATTALVAALAGGLGSARGVAAAGAVAVLVLLGRSLRWFPGYRL